MWCTREAAEDTLSARSAEAAAYHSEPAVSQADSRPDMGTSSKRESIIGPYVWVTAAMEPIYTRRIEIFSGNCQWGNQMDLYLKFNQCLVNYQRTVCSQQRIRMDHFMWTQKWNKVIFVNVKSLTEHVEELLSYYRILIYSDFIVGMLYDKDITMYSINPCHELLFSWCTIIENWNVYSLLMSKTLNGIWWIVMCCPLWLCESIYCSVNLFNRWKSREKINTLTNTN